MNFWNAEYILFSRNLLHTWRRTQTYDNAINTSCTKNWSFHGTYIDWPPQRNWKLTFRALANRQSESTYCGLHLVHMENSGTTGTLPSVWVVCYYWSTGLLWWLRFVPLSQSVKRHLKLHDTIKSEKYVESFMVIFCHSGLWKVSLFWPDYFQPKSQLKRNKGMQHGLLITRYWTLLQIGIDAVLLKFLPERHWHLID